MDLERWAKIEEIFQAALDRPADLREEFVNEQCAADNELRAEVQKLVDRYETEESFLESPVWTDSRLFQSEVKKEIASSLEEEIAAADKIESYLGRRIGAYKLVAEIGKGGMGVVYLGERADGEFNQQVAIKLIKRGMDTDFIVRRFRHERQILAALNHQNIARLFDGGITFDDSPYFAMEYIEGEPLFKFCKKNNLGISERLKIFREICAAVAYAHSKQIVHRDIKPGNILVTGDGTPKLLDFGIAKILDEDLIHESAMPTATAMRLMTPEYASPEQIRGEEITPASDQYSLGVLLYELVTGNRPYKFSSRSPHEIARVICEEIPSEPSSGEFGKLIAGNEDLSLDADFCKKLDRIVLKSLRKNPAERYASVADLAADIRRILRGETVRAESFAGESDKIEFPPATASRKKEKFTVAANANKTLPDINNAPSNENNISPRWKGVKQGFFLMILAFLLIPFTVILTVAGLFSGRLSVFVFLLTFLGGIIRIVYALLFELRSAAPNQTGFGNSKIFDLSQTQLISSAPPSTQFENKKSVTAGKIGGGESDSEIGEASKNTESDRNNNLTVSSPENRTATNFNESKRRFSVPLKYALPAVLIIIAAAFSYIVFSHLTVNFTPEAASDKSWRNGFISTMNARRLTTTGKAQRAILSPDASLVAYISDDGMRQSLWLRHAGADDAKQIVQPEAVYFLDFHFSPDGKYIYYVIGVASSRELYRISADSGGAPEKVLDGVFNSFAFTPDAKQMIYETYDAASKRRFLMLAELDENSFPKSVQTLVTLDAPNYFSGGFAFAPDGKTFVYPVSSISGNKEVVELYTFDLDAKFAAKLGTHNFSDVFATAWRKNGDEIVVNAAENDNSPYQLWLVSFPSGEVSRLTNDFNNYTGVNLSEDSNVLVTSEQTSNANVWTTQLTESKQNFNSKTKQISNGVDREDGVDGVNWTRDGRVLYVARAGEQRSIVLADADGTNSRTIPTGASSPSLPSLTSDNRYLIFRDDKEQESNIWRFDLTNNELEKLISTYTVTPALSPDNQFIYYSSFPNPATNKLTIHRKPLTGGEETQITDQTSVRPVISPDGRFVACNYSDARQTGNTWQIAVLPFDGGAPAQIVKVFPEAYFRSPQLRPLAWSPDNRSLFYALDKEGVSNIFRINIKDSSTPVQMSHFTSGEIFDFALAPDGKSAVLSRGSNSSDIIVFKNEQ